MIRRYIAWRNRHADDEALYALVSAQTLPDAALGATESPGNPPKCRDRRNLWRGLPLIGLPHPLPKTFDRDEVDEAPLHHRHTHAIHSACSARLASGAGPGHYFSALLANYFGPDSSGQQAARPILGYGHRSEPPSVEERGSSGQIVDADRVVLGRLLGPPTIKREQVGKRPLPAPR